MEGGIGTILTDVGTVFTQSLTWVGSVAETISGEPILLIFCILPLVGLGVGLLKRLISM